MKPATPKTELLPSTRLRKAVFGGAPKKVALLLFSFAVLLTGGAAAVRGQSALDAFNPNANGAVRVVAVQADGKILAGEISRSSAGKPAAYLRVSRMTLPRCKTWR